MAKSIYDIAPDSTYQDAAKSAVSQQVQELMTHLPGSRAGDDPEALHDMRVASRRLRAALSVFAAAFPPKPFRLLEKQAEQITDALGAVRDWDVLVEFVTKERDAAPAAQRVGVEALLHHLQQQRDQDRIVLVKALNKLEKSHFQKDFETLMTGDEAASHG